MERHRSTDAGSNRTCGTTVAPQEVTPDTASNQAAENEEMEPVARKGSVAKSESASQKVTTRM